MLRAWLMLLMSGLIVSEVCQLYRQKEIAMSGCKPHWLGVSV
jgi:hypothetical protein